MRKYIFLALSVLVVTQLSACFPLAVMGVGEGVAVGTDPRTAGTQLADKEIEFNASSHLAGQYPSAQVHVNTTSYDRVVLLTGQVPDEATRQQIQSLVQAVPDVAKIVNQLQVGTPTGLETRGHDVLLGGAVRTRLLQVGTLPISAIKIIVENGVVYLMGELSNQDAAEAINIARNTQGVLTVVTLFETH